MSVKSKGNCTSLTINAKVELQDYSRNHKNLKQFDLVSWIETSFSKRIDRSTILKILKQKF